MDLDTVMPSTTSLALSLVAWVSPAHHQASTFMCLLFPRRKWQESLEITPNQTLPSSFCPMINCTKQCCLLDFASLSQSRELVRSLMISVRRIYFFAILVEMAFLHLPPLMMALHVYPEWCIGYTTCFGIAKLILSWWWHSKLFGQRATHVHLLATNALLLVMAILPCHHSLELLFQRGKRLVNCNNQKHNGWTPNI